MKEFELYEEDAYLEVLGKRVMQHNAITSGRFDFTACQLDIMFMLLAMLKPNELVYKVYMKDIELITGRRWNYHQLIEATANIGSRMFEVQAADSYKQIWLFQQFEHLEGQGAFEVMLSQPSIPYFFELKNNFTSIQLKSVLSCSSKYAKRLYSLGCQWRSTGRIVYTIEELKQMLHLSHKYDEISSFKERVLDVAKEQINANTDLEFDYKLHKKGRSFHAVEIFINQRPPTQLNIDYNKELQEQMSEGYINKIKAYGLSENQANQIAKGVKEAEFSKIIEDATERVKQGKLTVLNSSAYIVGIFKKKGVLV